LVFELYCNTNLNIPYVCPDSNITTIQIKKWEFQVKNSILQNDHFAFRTFKLNNIIPYKL